MYIFIIVSDMLAFDVAVTWLLNEIIGTCKGLSYKSF